MMIGFGLGIGCLGRFAPAFVPLLTPQQIGGSALVYWQDGIAGTTLEGGDVRRTTGLTDQSTTGNNMVTIASSQRPQCEPTGWNGDAALWFDGNDSLVSTDAAFAAALLSQDLLVTLDVQVSSTVATQVLFSISASADATHYFRIQSSSSGFQVLARGTSLKTCTAAGTATTSRVILQVSRTSSGTVTGMWINGVAQTLDTTDVSVGAITVTRVGVGVFYANTTTLFLTGRMRSVALHSGAFTSQQRLDYYAWCAAKGADNSLPMLLIDGNSHTETYPSNPQNSWVPYLTKQCTVMNIAHQGDTQTGQINPRLTELATNYSASRPATAAVNVSSVGNDIAVSGATLANAQAYITAWADGIKAINAGIRTIVTTIPARTDCTAGEETVRTQYNAWLLATPPASVNRVVNLDALLASALGDGVHWSAAQASTIVAPAMDTALGLEGFAA